MSDEIFLLKYEELLDKDYCNCNEMNCIDNNSPRRILNIAKKLQQENQKYKEVIDKVINELFNLKDMIYKPETRYENIDIQRKISSIIKNLNVKEVK